MRSIMLLVKRVNPPVLDRDMERNLLLLLGEELKRPLVSIRQLAEMAESELSEQMSAHAKHALMTIDNILLYQRMSSGQTNLNLEPVHVGSAIHEAAKQVEPLMREAGCRTELIIQHSLQPVDADRNLLTSAIVSLWQGLITTANPSSDIICQAKKTPFGVRISIHSKSINIGNINFSTANKKSSQPIKGISGPATDIITAQGLFELLGTGISKSSYNNTVGLGATLQISRQLQMV